MGYRRIGRREPSLRTTEVPSAEEIEAGLRIALLARVQDRLLPVPWPNAANKHRYNTEECKCTHSPQE